jgi:hypothetical protein
MILYLDEDRAYLSWVAHHRRGFVLDGKHKPRLSHLMLHRATCPAIKSAPSRRFHWTTGAKLKACSLNREELAAWVAEQTAAPLTRCAECRPDSDAEPVTGGNTRPSRLAREILDYVLDAAVIHLEHEYPPYRLTVGDIAACFAKTPGQLAAAIHRLVEDGLLAIRGSYAGNRALSPKQVVLPTVLALKTLEAFQNESDAAVSSEIGRLEAT